VNLAVENKKPLENQLINKRFSTEDGTWNYWIS